MYDLKGKKALITGSSQGIGKAIAKKLASCGALVWVHASRDAAKAQRVADEIIQMGYCARSCTADLLDSHAAQKLFAQTGKIDILVINASVQIRANWMDITPEQFEQQMTVNFKQSLFLAQQYVPAMITQKWGRIVTVGSVQQYKPHEQMLVYAASKQAQLSMVRSLARQLACNNITVNNIAPGTINTPRNESVLSNDVYRKKCMDAIPCGRFGTAEDCAELAVLLCSEESSYLTGCDIPCDGGLHL